MLDKDLYGTHKKDPQDGPIIMYKLIDDRTLKIISSRQILQAVHHDRSHKRQMNQ